MHTTPASKQDMDALVAEFRAGFRMVAEAIKPLSGTIQNVTVPQPQPQPQKAERLAWAMFAMVAIMGVLAGGATVAAVLQGQRVTDLRADMHAERLSREAFDNWNAQEVTAIRSYITNGKLQPMAQRPDQSSEEPPK